MGCIGGLGLCLFLSEGLLGRLKVSKIEFLAQRPSKEAPKELAGLKCKSKTLDYANCSSSEGCVSANQQAPSLQKSSTSKPFMGVAEN